MNLLSTLIISMIITIALIPFFRGLADKVDAAFPRVFLKGLFFILPDFANLNLSDRVVHQIPIPFSEVAWLWVYAAGYLGLLLFFSAWIFSRRDLT